MDFRFSEDQQDLIYAAKAFFDGENTAERMRAMVAGEEVSDLWPQFGELGLLGIMAPESAGGLEQPLVVMVAIAEAAGYAGLPEPLVEVAAIAIPLMSKEARGNNETKRILEKLLSGEIMVGLVSPFSKVNFAQNCHSVVVVGKEESSTIWTGSAQVQKLESIDPLRNISKTNFTSGQSNNLADFHGAALTAAQLIGLSKRMVDMSVEYAKDRHQFGKAIGSFQAVKHQLANVYTQIEFTRPIIHLAAIKGGAAVHNAKVAAIDTAMLAAETAIQVHGGMGYTYEVDLHLFMKRAWALCGEWGDRNYHMKKLEDYVLNGDAELGPGQTFA